MSERLDKEHTAAPPTGRAIREEHVSRRLVAVLTLTAVGSVTLGCAASRHAGRGVVLRVNPDAPALTISHDAIPGYMDAMVMDLPVRGPDAPLADVVPGDRIAFRLRVDARRQQSWIDRLQVISAARPDAGLTRSPARAALVPLGGEVPDFSLVDQHGRDVTRATLRGQVVAITFIYTRCPLPDYCPRMLAHFKAVRARFAPRLGRDLTLVTVTFDPKHDTVDTLRAYAQAHGADVPGWRFLTGPLDRITNLCEAFGVEFWPEEGLLSHSLQTAVLDREGRLAGTIEGRTYTAAQLGDLIASVLDPGDR